MKTRMFLRKEDGKDYFAAEFEGEKVYNFYVKQCQKHNVPHKIENGELVIANKVVFVLV